MMIIFGAIVGVTIALESYIIACKMHIKETKIYYYFFNLLTLILGLIIFFYTYITKINTDTMIVIGLILSILTICSIFEYIYQKKRTIDKSIIKKTIDNSNSGIIAIKNKSKVMFQNSTMYNIMKNLNIYDDYIENIKEKAIKQIGNDYIVLVNSKAYLFCISEDQNEITAFDINEEYQLQNELKEQNAKLNSNNEEMLWTINNLEEIEREEKTLKLKNKFHDILGQNLSVLQGYLNQDIKDEKKFEEVKFMIKKMFTELEDTDSPETNLENLIKVNENIGIKIQVEGKLPEDREKAKVLFEVIREAVTNAIRHADSTEIYVKIENKMGSGLTMTITNNGKKPKETIVENEGIKGMRRKVENLNGSLFVKTIPKFTLEIGLGYIGDVS